MDRLQAAVEQLAAAGVEERRCCVHAPRSRRVHIGSDWLLDYCRSSQEAPAGAFVREGAFLLVAVERLLDSYLSHAHKHADPVADLRDSIRAIELHRKSFIETRLKIRNSALREKGIANAATEKLLDAWLIQGDFLLTDFPFQFTHIVGNPPYVRQEMIPSPVASGIPASF